MKTLPSLFMALALCSCASDNKDPATGSAGATKTNSAVTMAPLVRDGNCPTLEGEFTKRTKVENGDSVEDHAITIALHTKREGSNYSYHFGSPDLQFVLADGELKRISTSEGSGTFRVTCGNNAAEIWAKKDGEASPYVTRFTLVDANTLRVDESGPDSMESGLYKRE